MKECLFADQIIHAWIPRIVYAKRSRVLNYVKISALIDSDLANRDKSSLGTRRVFHWRRVFTAALDIRFFVPVVTHEARVWSTYPT